MSDHIRRESPLVGHKLAARARPTHPGTGVVLRERAFLGHINLRGDSQDPAFFKAVRAALALELPRFPNTAATGNGLVAYWLGPDEWLIVTPEDREVEVAEALRAACSGPWVSVVEVGGGQTVLELRGPGVREVLAKGVPLDLHPRAFADGQCAQTHCAKAPLLLRPLDDGIEVIVRRSFADYFFQWLEEAAHDLGLGIAA